MVCLGFGVPVPISRSGTERSGKGICSLAHSDMSFRLRCQAGLRHQRSGCMKGIVREEAVHHLSGF